MSDDARPIEVSFDLTPEEWVEVALEHNMRSPIYLKARKDSTIVFGAIMVLLTVFSWLSGLGLLSLAWLLGGGIVTALMPKLIERSHRKQYQRFAEDGIANGMFGTHRVRLLDEGVLDETDAYQWLTRWHAIDRVADGSDSFMIYTGTNSFLPIPHSAFRDAETLRAFADRFYSLTGDGAKAALPSEEDTP